MSEPHDVIDRATRTLRQPVELEAAAKRRLVAALRQAPAPRVGPALRAWRWLARPRQVMVSPLAGLAAVAGITLVVVMRTTLVEEGVRGAADPPVAEAPTGAGAATLAGTSPAVSFRLEAPGASSVSIVGDFNDWDPRRHPLRPSPRGDGVWEIAVPLEPGLHVYSFFVNGRQWVPDPAAARAADDAYGTPSSVILVSERSS